MPKNATIKIIKQLINYFKTLCNLISHEPQKGQWAKLVQMFTTNVTYVAGQYTKDQTV